MKDRIINISNVISVFVIISFIRFISVFDDYKTNLGVFLRPGNKIYDVSLFAKIIFGLVAVFALFYLTKTLRKADFRIKNYSFFLMLFFYIVSAFSQRKVYKNYTYIYSLQAFNIKFSDLIPFFEQDLFWEEPYIFWFILLMSGVFWFLYRRNNQEYSTLLWIIPFYFLDFPINSIFVTYGITILILSIFAMKYCKTNSSVFFHLIQFVLYLTTIIYIYYTSFPNKNYLLYSCEMLLLYYLPSFLFIYICLKDKGQNNVSVTWSVPAITTLLAAMPETKTDLEQVIINTTSLINSFLFLGNIAISVSVILLVSLLVNKTFKKITYISFLLLSALVVGYYSLDSLLYHYSHFRINQQTLVWTMNMDDIVGTTMKTCLNYIDFKSWLFILGAIIVITIFLKNSYRLFAKQSSLRFLCLVIILSAHIGSFLYPLVSKVTVPQLQDPFFSMLKEIEFKDKSKILSDDEIRIGFSNSKTPVKIFENKEAVMGNGYNCILITLESVHWRYLDIFCEEKPKTWPKMSRYKDRMEIFPYFFSNFPESTIGDVAVVAGLQLFSPYYIINKQIWACPTITDELKKANYETYLFSSESLVDGNLIAMVKAMKFDSVLSYTSSMVDNSDDYWYWGIKEEKNVKNIIEALSKRDNNKPYFVWYRTVYPHAPFTVFENIQDLVFKPENILIKDTVMDYKNCLIYVDKQLSKLVEDVDKLDKKTNRKTIFFIVADHGEMLGEKDNAGLFGHGLYLTSKLANCPFIILYPEAKGLKINKKFGSQIDVLPTILDCLKLKPTVKRYEIGESLFLNQDSSRPIYLSSLKSYALVENGYYYFFIDKDSPECAVEKISMDKNYKAVFEESELKDNELIMEKYNRIKKYFELQTDFINSLKY